MSNIQLNTFFSNISNLLVGHADNPASFHGTGPVYFSTLRWYLARKATYVYV